MTPYCIFKDQNQFIRLTYETMTAMSPGTLFTCTVRSYGFASTIVFIKMGMRNFLEDENDGEGDDRMEVRTN